MGLVELFVIFAICVFSGFLTGLLSVGGGLVIIPVFLCVMPFFGINLSAQQIIAISTVCVLMNTTATLFFRRKEKFLNLKHIIKDGIAVGLGTSIGTYVASFFPDKILFSIYVLLTVISIYLIKKDVYFDLNKPALKPIKYLCFFFTGALSASIGIGGAMLFATILKCFAGKDIKFLLPSISVLVFCNAFFAFMGKLAFGFVIWEIIPIAIISSFIGSKIGVKISHKLSDKTLTNLLCIFLLFAAVRVLFELIFG